MKNVSVEKYEALEKEHANFKELALTWFRRYEGDLQKQIDDINYKLGLCEKFRTEIYNLKEKKND
jgi:hypothetical protein